MWKIVEQVFIHILVRRKRIWDIFSIVVVGDFLIKEFCIWYLRENWPGA